MAQPSPLLVQFYQEAVESEFETIRQGRPVFVNQDCVRIVVPGSREETCRVATPEDKARYASQWAAYKARAEQPFEGTPLEQWTYSDPAFVREMAYAQVRTVEQLANLSDTAAMSLGMGLLEKRELARGWLAKASGDEAKVAAIADENAAMKAKLDAQAAELAALKQMLEEVTKPAAPPAV